MFDALGSTVVGQVDATNGANSAPDVLYQLDAEGVAVATEQSGAGSGTFFLDSDGTGSVTNVVGTNYARACSASYDPFGSPHDPASSFNGVCASGSGASTTANSLWYRGQSRDASSGNYQLGTRTYDPKTGAFSTPDTYRAGDSDVNLSVGIDPLTANTYSYVNGDPINMIDPTGHYPSCGAASCDAPPVSENLREERAEKVGERATRDMKAWKKARDPKARAARLEKEAARLTKQANAEFNWRKEAVNIFGEVSGINDLVGCVSRGSAGACFATFAGLAGAAIWKSAKFVKGGHRLMRAYDRFNDAKRSARASLKNINTKRKQLAEDMAALKRTRTPSPAAASAKTSAPTRSTRSGGVCSAGMKSFSGSTLVLMADGTRKPIRKVRIGDRVIATDPETGRSAPQMVTKTWVHTDDLTDLVLADGEVLTTTTDHPFWNATDVEWQEIGDFETGDAVVTDDWLPIEVTGLDPGTTHRALAYNLTVANTHTYHVGASDVLVHNIGCGDEVSAANSGPRIAAKTVPDTAIRPVGAMLESVDDVMKNPSLLAGKHPAQVENVLRGSSGWEAGVLGRGRSAGSGWTFRELNSRGTDYTGRYIQWSPGSPRHFDGDPYWKVSSGDLGTVRFPG